MASPAGALAAALLAAGTTWVALTSWSGFVELPGTFLQPLLVVALTTATAGSVLRLVGVGPWLAAATQVALAAVVVTNEITGSPVPVGGTGAALAEALRASVESARLYQSPIGDGVPPVWPLMLVGGAVFLVLVDALALGFRRVAGAGLALLAVYAVPSGLLVDGPGWPSFLLAAAGFLTLLHLDARDRVQHWGRTIGPPDTSAWGPGNAVREAARAGAGRIAVLSALAAVAIAPLLPVSGLDLLELGTGGGGGAGDITIRRPVADMRRDLERGVDRTLIRFETDDPSPSYLRVAVLNRYTGEEWSTGDRDIARQDRADGELPLPPGLSDRVPRVTFDHRLVVSDAFDSTWLPSAFPAAAVDAEGDWRFDPDTMDFLARDESLDTRGLTYTFTALEPGYGTTGEFFRDAPAGATDEEVLELPEVPAVVEDLARSVTAPATSDYERALLLQRWFRRDGGFRYDLRAAPRGTGNETLETFLTTGRVGYCEQYASAMAVMARDLGIPARVAVGFLEPDLMPDGTWEYSSHDLHAWPELYFAGAGWVRFEPTPAGRVESVPDYSRVPVAGLGEDLPDGATQDPTTAAPVSPAPVPEAPAEEDPTTEASSSDGGLTRASALLGGAVLLVLVLVAGAVGPRRWRGRTRRTRRDGDAEARWAEVRATALDLGVPWPTGRSPREVAAVVRDHLADPAAPAAERPRTGPLEAPEAAAALDRLVGAVELGRYARPGSVTTLERPGAEDLDLVLAALTAGVPRRARQRAQWWPRSVWRRG